jgi:hypothetical protein
MPDYWFWLFLAVAVLLWLGSLLAVRHWTRKKILASLEAETLEGEDIPLPFTDPRPEDKQALEVVRTFRRRCLLKLWPDTEFSLKIVMGLALDLIQQIAGVYHPDDERPELHASLSELLNLQTRISVRLQALLETLPLRAIKDVELETILFYHKIYQQFVSHPAYMFLKRHHLDRIARYAWMVKNIASPWYWGYRAAYAGGKEMLARFFLSRMSTIVGVEAIRLYSGRAPGAEQWRKYDLAVQEILFMTAANGASEAEAQRFLLRLILKSRELPEPAKLLLIDRISRCKADKPAEFDRLTRTERGQVRRWLKQFIVKAVPPAVQKIRLQELRQRLAEPIDDSGERV